MDFHKSPIRRTPSKYRQLNYYFSLPARSSLPHRVGQRSGRASSVFLSRSKDQFAFECVNCRCKNLVCGRYVALVFASDLHDGFSTFSIIRFLFRLAFPAFHRHRHGSTSRSISRARKRVSPGTRARLDKGIRATTLTSKSFVKYFFLCVCVYSKISLLSI